MSKKTKIIHITLFCIFILFSMTVFAFIIKETTSSSILTFGSLKMRVIETTIENGIEKEIENGKSMSLMTNSNFNRDIKIENTGEQEMYVRVSFNIEGKKGNNIKESEGKTSKESKVKSNEIENNKEFDASSLVDINADSENWIYKDGWYYYKTSIKPKEITNNLKINIKFKMDKISSAHSGGEFNLNIKSEALQYKNNSENVLEARGWPSN